MRALAVIAVLALVAGCGKKEETTAVAPGVTVTTAKGGGSDTATINIAGAGTITGSTGEAGMAPPADLPAWGPVYPGGKVVSTMSGIMGSGSGKTVSIETGDPAAKVAAFYDARLAAAGIKPTMATDSVDAAMRMIPGDKGTAGMIAVAKKDEGGSTVMLSYGMK